jgi:hypothetical protein
VDVPGLQHVLHLSNTHCIIVDHQGGHCRGTHTGGREEGRWEVRNQVAVGWSAAAVLQGCTK